MSAGSGVRNLRELAPSHLREQLKRKGWALPDYVKGGHWVAHRIRPKGEPR